MARSAHAVAGVVLAWIAVSAMGLTAPSPDRAAQCEERYRAYLARLQQVHADFAAALLKNAPDLAPRIEKAAPRAVPHGYQVLPRFVPDVAPPAAPPRTVSTSYSWPRTDGMIAQQMARLDSLAADIGRAAALPAADRRAAWEKAVAAWPSFPIDQRTIESHVQYNRLWQSEIAQHRAEYDRQTSLHHAAMERQDLTDALAATDQAGFLKALGAVATSNPESPLAGIAPGVRSQEVDVTLRARVEVLSRTIHEATGATVVPTYLRIARHGSHRWTVHVPIYTDIEDRAFLKTFREDVENIWHVQDGDDEYGVKIEIRRLSPARLYARAPGCREQVAKAGPGKDERDAGAAGSAVTGSSGGGSGAAGSLAGGSGAAGSRAAVSGAAVSGAAGSGAAGSNAAGSRAAICSPPPPGAAIDLAKHVALFPDGGGAITTGAVTTHVAAGHVIALGPQDIAPHVLAHEFGHLLGFRDVYFRGYKDLGADGFEVMEVIADPDDIMGAPGVGPVRNRHFEELIRRLP